MSRSRSRPGQELEHYAWERTEEGFSSEWRCWSHAGHFVERLWANNSRDCDGRYQSSGEDRCHMQKLYWHRVWDARVLDGELVRVLSDEYPPFPLWINIDSAQRDYAAEAAGY